MPKKRRVPEVLWRLFRDRAQTLANTILSLISRSQSFRSTDTSFLFQPDDPTDYRTLLNRCFVVINDNAPPFLEFHTQNRWPQRQIVQRVIEMIMRDQPMSSNVICSAYDKCHHLSPVVDILTGSAWMLLLKRVGDDVMFYLLKHTSIFLLHSRKKHQQVAGPSVCNLVPKWPKHNAEQQRQQSSTGCLGPRKKRDKVDNGNLMFKRQKVSAHCLDDSTPFSGHPADKCGQMSFTKAAPPTIGGSALKYEGHLNEDIKGLNQITGKPKKRSRQFRWQRHRKRRHLDTKQTSDKACHTMDCIDQGSSSGILQYDFNSCLSCYPEKLQMLQQCSCCRVVLQTPHLVTKGAQISRQPIFYCLEKFPSVLPLKHVLNSLNPNVIGSKSLMHSIFGLSDINLTPSKPCSHRSDVFLIGSACLSPFWATNDINEAQHTLLELVRLVKSMLDSFVVLLSALGSVELEQPHVWPTLFIDLHGANLLFKFPERYHSLVKLLKVLIRQTRCCKHLRLLDKHCAVSSLNQNTMVNSDSEFEGNDLERELSKKSHVANAEHCKATPKTIDPQIEALKSYCSKSQVVSFIWAVCRNLVPPDLLGTPSNWRILRRNISKFVRLRRYEKFSLNQCMHKLKTLDFPFLSDKHSSCGLDAQVLNKVPGQSVDMRKGFHEWNDAVNNMKHMLLQKWIFWFFSYLVVPLVQANFYVTEREGGKQDIYYYRKSIWEKIKNRAMEADLNYQYLDATNVRSIISHRSFGFSKLRLLPKENGVRMLANLKAPSRIPAQESTSRAHSSGMQNRTQFSCKSVKFKHFKSVNNFLRDTSAVLKGIQLKQPEKLGSSVFNYNDIYSKLCPFITGLKNGSTTMPDVFIVVSDVSKAFDSVDQDKLLSVMKELRLEDQCFLKQFYQVVCTKKSLWVHEHLTLTDPNSSTGSTSMSSSVPFGSLHTVLVNQVWPSMGFEILLKDKLAPYMDNEQGKERKMKRILEHQGCSKILKKEELLFNLNEHLKQNVLQLDKKFYLQCMGIPQGSILSPLLCSLYYGHLERTVIFPFLEKRHGPTIEYLHKEHNSQDASAAESSSEDKVIPASCYMLLRLVDDFLFISTSKKQATNFFLRLRRGFPDYNCYMNEEKFCCNFDMGYASGLPSNRVYVGEDGILFLRWSGFLLNSCTLEVQADYTRYLKNHLSSCLTVCWQGKPAHHLKMKLCFFMRPKCHPIFFDSNINSSPVVRLNIYQAFLLCAMKFHCYVSDMSYICKLHTRSYLKMIERSLRHTYVLIKKRMLSVHLGSYFHPVLKLEEKEVEWLGLNAYIQVLKRKQSRHKELLSLLRVKLSTHSIGGIVSSQLRYAIDSSHSSLIWKIKY